jgi:N-acetylglucosamine-6-sulfatase
MDLGVGVALKGALAAATLVTAALLLFACGREDETKIKSPAPPGGRPNVILILADDLDKSVFSRTTLDSAWVPEGASFSNAVDTTSLCCPSRASILRGQYAHNTGLWNNDDSEPGGGEKFFREEGLDGSTLATLLKDGGYETWYGGKYLNGYDDTYVPPGWEHWQAYLSTGINVDGRVVPYQDHYTDWLSRRAAGFIEGHQGSSRPFFMHVSTLDTHEPLIAPPRHAAAYSDARAPRPPSFDEEDVSDKPRWVRDEKPITSSVAAQYDRRQILRMRSALTLEDLCRNLVGALKRTGQLDDTYIIFTSDNGYEMGLHGLKVAPKSTPYTEAHEVPFVVRGPGVPKGASFDELVANIDIAPTVLGLAGIEEPGWMDGRSFEPFLEGGAPPRWRDSLLIEGAKSDNPQRPAYSGVRRENEVYVRYESGEEEYYDLENDPYQLESRPRDLPASLKERLETMKNCGGDDCHRAEGP